MGEDTVSIDEDTRFAIQVIAYVQLANLAKIENAKMRNKKATSVNYQLTEVEKKLFAFLENASMILLEQMSSYLATWTGEIYESHKGSDQE